MAKVKAAYNYSYNYEGKKISFKKDEEFQLLTKSNKDWWQVRRWMEGSAQDIYVPAVYVKEVEEEVVMKIEDDPTYMNLSELQMKVAENGSGGGGADPPTILTKPKKRSSIKRNTSMEKDKEKPHFERGNSGDSLEGALKTNGLNTSRPISPSMLRRLNQGKPPAAGNSPLPQQPLQQAPQGAGSLKRGENFGPPNPGVSSVKKGENLGPPPVQTKPRSKSNVAESAVESSLDSGPRGIARQTSNPKCKVPPPVQTKPRPQKSTAPRPMSCMSPGSELEGVGRAALGENTEVGGAAGKPIASVLSNVLLKMNPHLANEHKMLGKTTSSGVVETSSSKAPGVVAATSEGLSKSLDFRQVNSSQDTQQNRVSDLCVGMCVCMSMYVRMCVCTCMCMCVCVYV